MSELTKTLEIRGTNVLERNLAATKRFVVNQGGTRSSKTTSLAQLFVIRAHNLQGEVLSVVRKTMPALRASAMRDMISILKSLGIYREDDHNKSENIYRLHGNEIEFFGLDEPQKVRGRKRRILWMNEANEFTYEDFMQLNLRTTDQVFLDYNPSDEFHWIYEKVIPRDDAELIKSTYLDNPFLEKALTDEILRLRDEDENYWRIYGLGEIGQRKSIIFTNWDECDDFPKCDEVIYGLDFGFNHPTALVAIGFKDESPNEAWVEERVYQSGLTNAEFMLMMDEKVVEPYAEVYADSEDPQRIEEIARYTRKDGSSFNIHPAVKGKDSVRESIDRVKGFKLHITKGSTNVKAEIKGYKWKEDKNGNILDEPVKFKDDAMAAIRYPIFSHPIRRGQGFRVLFGA